MNNFIIKSISFLLFCQLTGCGGGDSNKANSDDGAGLVPIVDSQAPVIILTGEPSIELPYGSSYVEQGATVTDNIDTGLTATITGNVDSSIIGNYELNYNASDTAGNAATTVTRMVNVTDSITPVITLIGENPLEVVYGTPYVEQGATVTDNADSGLQATVTGTVDTSTVGSYEISYNVSDASGNTAVTATRVVNVVLLTGNLSGSVITGLSYKTETQSGVTDASGSYVYGNGETITFSIGNTIIGDTVPAKIEITPFDLVNDAVLYTNYAQLRHAIDDLSVNSKEYKALTKFSNILTFLHTFDDDANPENGITIKEGVASLFTGFQVDFEKSLFTFDEYKKLRVITYQAFSEGLLSSPYMKKAGSSLDQYYRSHNISHDLAVQATGSIDENGDGQPNSTISNTYDDNGNLLTVHNDNNADNEPDNIITFTYDDNNNILTLSYDNNADSQSDRVYTHTYDANGNKLTYNSSDGEGRIAYEYVYTYDSKGNQISRNFTHAAVAGSSITIYTYDDNGNQVSMRSLNSDGVPANIITYTYDDNGHQLTRENDSDANGHPNSIHTQTYDANGNRLTISRDSNADGAQNDIQTFTYDANNNILTQSNDSDGDGHPNFIRTSTYDNNANPLIVSIDKNGDGRLNTIETLTYDALGHILTYSIDANADGQVNDTYTMTYDARGNQLSSSGDIGSDGSANDLISLTYDADSNMLTYTEDRDADNSPDLIEKYTYTNSTWLGVFNALKLLQLR